MFCVFSSCFPLILRLFPIIFPTQKNRLERQPEGRNYTLPSALFLPLPCYLRSCFLTHFVVQIYHFVKIKISLKNRLILFSVFYVLFCLLGFYSALSQVALLVLKCIVYF